MFGFSPFSLFFFLLFQRFKEKAHIVVKLLISPLSKLTAFCVLNLFEILLFRYYPEKRRNRRKSEIKTGLLLFSLTTRLFISVFIIIYASRAVVPLQLRLMFLRIAHG